MTNKTSAATSPRLIDRVGEHVEGMFHRIFGRIPLRVSLLSGCFLVLVTLFLPLTIDGCGHGSGPGTNLVSGKPDCYWPGLVVNSLTPDRGRGFYLFLLAFAIFSGVLALVTLATRKISGPRPTIKSLLAIGGTTSVLVSADYGALLVGATCGWLTDTFGIEGTVWLATDLSLIFLVCVRCLRAKSVRASRWPWTIFIVAGGLCCVLGGLQVYQRIWKVHIIGEDTVLGTVMLTSIILYLIAPLSLWYRLGLWPTAELSRHWLPVRRRLALAFLPAVAGQFFAAYLAVTGNFWGLIPCLCGIHLLTLGYAQLAQQADACSSSTVASFSGEMTGMPFSARLKTLSSREQVQQ